MEQTERQIHIKERDFVELDYTGKLADSMQVFDTTDEATAKAQNIFDQNMSYAPLIICVKEGHLLPGLDSKLVGLEAGKEYKFRLTPEGGFGKKDGKLFKLISRTTFTKEKIDPVPGLQITVDGLLGTVRSVTGGRVVVDFNHPLAGRELEYEIKVHRIVSDPKEQIRALVRIMAKLDANVYLSDSNAVVELDSELPDDLKESLRKKIVKLVHIHTVDFLKREPKEKEKKKEEQEQK